MVNKKMSDAAKRRWASQKAQPKSIELSPSDKEALAWAHEHRANVELRNKAIALVFMFAFGIGGSFVVNYYGLPGLTSFVQGFFFELGVLVPIFLIELGIGRKVLQSDGAALGLVVVAAAVAAALALAALTAAALAAAALAAAAVAAVALAALMVEDETR